MDTERTREGIVAGASAMFRKKGMRNVSVADVMANSGLTHGGFYAHFGSRDELVEEVIRFTLTQSAHRIYLSAIKNGDRPGYSKLIEIYLTNRHRDNPQDGCVLASLGAEIGREQSGTRAVFAQGFEELIDLLEPLSPERSRPARRAHLLGVLSTLTGTLMLARAATDRRVADEILGASRRLLLAGELDRQGRR